MRSMARSTGRVVPFGHLGFTLAEVIVSLLVLEVGVLGTAGTLFIAQRTLSRAEAEERGVCEVERVLDSLGAGAEPGAGARAALEGTTSWSLASDGHLRVRYASTTWGVVVSLEALVPVSHGEAR